MRGTVRTTHLRFGRAAAMVLTLAAVAGCASAGAGGAVTTATRGAASDPTASVAVDSSSVVTTGSPVAATTSVVVPTSPAPTTTNPAAHPQVLADVIAGAALGPVPSGTRVASAGNDRAVVYTNGCHVVWGDTRPKKGCIYGDTSSKVVIVVTGDSHAAHWFGAFDEAGKANHWKIVMVTKQGCPTADVTVYSAAQSKGPYPVYTACDTWRRHAIDYINSLHPALVAFPMLSRRAAVGHPGAGALRAWGAGLGRSIDEVAIDGAKVLVLGDTPKTNGQNIPSCVAGHRKNVKPCGNTRSAAVLTDRLAMEAAAAKAHHATFVDPSNWFCTTQFCPAVIGDNVVYRDDHHLTDHYSRYRAPEVADAIRLALAAS